MTLPKAYQPRPWWRSRTVWVGLLVLVAFGLATAFDYELIPSRRWDSALKSVLGALMIFLRVISVGPVVVKE